jgi:hypothetical protein
MTCGISDVLSLRVILSEQSVNSKPNLDRRVKPIFTGDEVREEEYVEA